MAKYRAYFQQVHTLSDAKRTRMAEIYFQSYSGSNIQRFFSDLQSKDEVLFLELAGHLVGFSSVQFYQEENAIIIYSGDTIVMPEHWQQQILHQTWISRMALLKQQNPELSLYWLLLVKGLRTYKYLKVFANTFYPHWQRPEPELKRLANTLAVKKFGSLYNVQTGIVECPAEYGYLKQELADITPALHGRSEVDFFIQKNPHYARGHELVCLCEITPKNLIARYQSLFVNPSVEFCNE